MKFLPLVIVAAALSSPVAARTMEEVAAKAGQVAGGITRARFLCLAAGYPMPKIADYPEMQRDFAELLNDYPEFFKHGFEKGVIQANNLLKEKRDYPESCEFYRKMMMIRSPK